MKKIAIPITSDNTVEDHFGHSRFYEIYTFSSANQIVDVKLLEAEPGCGCKSNIVDVLADEDVSTLLAGNIGKGAMVKLNRAEIKVVRGCEGKSTDVILQYVGGEISDSGVSCNHHHKKHNHNHACNH